MDVFGVWCCLLTSGMDRLVSCAGVVGHLREMGIALSEERCGERATLPSAAGHASQLRLRCVVRLFVFYSFFSSYP